MIQKSITADECKAMEKNNLENFWPEKRSLFGVNISVTTYEDASKSVLKAATLHSSACVTHLAVHGLVTASGDKSYKGMLEKFDIVAPDGQPVRHAINILYKTNMPDCVCGTEFTLCLCKSAEKYNISIYLYGSHLGVVNALRNNLLIWYPNLKIVGAEPSIFRPLTENEDAALTKRINESGAGIVFLGLGCPLQEQFAFAHKDKITGVQICVGAVFDFLSGKKKRAPRWMQRSSLEWLFRLLQEPRRLWRRYLVTNTIFVIKFLLQFIGQKKLSSTD